MRLISVKDIDLKDKKVFIRCDFNVPMDEYGNITDDRRIRSALSTISYCLDQGCAVIVASHMGRPKGEVNSKYSLEPVRKRLSNLLKMDITMSSDVIGSDAHAKAESLQSGEVLLLENLRFEKGETKNDENVSKELASMAEAYVNDAFGVSHRAHASVEGITHLFDTEHKAAGFLLQKEIKYFDALLRRPSRPFVAVVGGSKVSSKLEALTNLLPKVDKLIIGGGMAFTFLKALGEDIGNSLVEDDLLDEAKAVMEQAQQLGVKLYLPVDVVAALSLSNDSETKIVPTKEIPSGWMGLDIGPASVMLFSQALDSAQTILWNGPMGVYEMEKFSRGSNKLANKIATSYSTSVVGGGDTADLVQRIGLDEEISFISTGGGASLELIEGKVLPGVAQLVDKTQEH